LIPFFGRPARLPLGPARLALITDATVLLGACYWDPEEGYVLHVEGPIEMVDTGDRKADAIANTRRLAEVMETYIRARPTQWLMFHRLWPA
jgi:lauroyl/myristoyl acyltransferase